MRAEAMRFDKDPPVSLALINTDLMPTAKNDRTWIWRDVAALWLGMVFCVPAYMLVGGLIDQGLSWRHAVATILIANCIVLIPMFAIGHAGSKHGIPFPVLLRASFGTRGAQLPALLRGLVACTCFGIQTWWAGTAIYTILNALTLHALEGDALPFLGINAGQLGCFLAFWLLQLWFIARGIDSIRRLALLSAPWLILICGALLYLAQQRVGGFSQLLATASSLSAGAEFDGQLFVVSWPALAAMVGFWATLALSVADFTRYVRSQRDQVIGQMLGLPLPMAALALVAVAISAMTVVVHGEAIWDPVKLIERFGGLGISLALVAVVLAALTTNLAAYAVASANVFSNLSPRLISFRTGGYITAALALVMLPWKLVEIGSGDFFAWLSASSIVLGPVLGIMLVDYFLIHGTELDREELYKEGGRYSYRGGFNPVAYSALLIGILPNLPGLIGVIGLVAEVPVVFKAFHPYAWFVGLAVAATAHFGLTKWRGSDT